MKRTDDVLEELKVALKISKESKKVVNEALAHAFSTIQKMHNDAAIEYERGCQDAWELAKNIMTDVYSGGYTSGEIRLIFDTVLPTKVFANYTALEALEKVREYEEKKAKEKQKLVRGDEVIADGGGIKFKGIFCGENDRYYWVISPDEAVPQKLPKDDVYEWVLTKTGKHVDIFGGNNE